MEKDFKLIFDKDSCIFIKINETVLTTEQNNVLNEIKPRVKMNTSAAFKHRHLV